MKKILTFILTLTATISCAFGLIACNTHTHDYKNLKFDSENHWFECECQEKSNVTAHNIVNGGCVCGYVVPHTHDYNTLKFDNVSHWFECFCGAKNGVENHKGGTATCIELAKCSVCNVKYGELKEHTAGSSGFCTTCDKPITSTEGLLYDISSDGTYYEVIGYSGTSKKVNITSSYNSLPVKTIYNEAFTNKDITTVIIPDSVTNIGDYAFLDCNSLTSVVIGDRVTSIGEGAFAGSSLASIVIPDSVTSIGAGAFSSCDSLTSIVIPDSITSIGYGAFYNCSKLITEKDFIKYVKINDNPYYLASEATNINLSTYTLHPGTKFIGDSLFSNFSMLSSVKIPDSVTNIGVFAFGFCSSLTSIEIPDSVTSIGVFAFGFCSSLTSIEIPDSVTSIDSDAFAGCSSLTICCEAKSQPSGWDSDWNPDDRPVVWGYKPQN